MKKFLATAAALGLVAGLAATASALELKVDGRYQADGYWINQGLGAAGGGGVNPWDWSDPYTMATFNAAMGILGFDVVAGDDSKNDDWYWHTFRINPTLIINDKVRVAGDLRLVDDDTVWGTQDDSGDLSDGRNIRMRKLWLIYDSPIGKLEVGRRPAGAWMYDFVNSSSAADRIMWWFPMPENFKGYAFLQKTTEQDGYDANLSDDDSDYYEVAGGYTAEGINAWLGVAWGKNNLNDSIPVTGSSTDAYRVKGYGDFKISDTFMMLGEFDYKFGQTEFNDGRPDRDIDALAGIIAGVGSFGDLTATLGYAYISGQDTSGDQTAYDPNHGMGDDFEPLYILTGYSCNILNGDLGPNPVGTAVRTSGAHAIVALADFKASEDLTLHGGLGWGQADNTDWLRDSLRAGGAPVADIDDAYGWEVDLGLAYKLYQNLTYEVHFGWWAVGDFAELGAGVQTEDIYLLSHHLTMNF